MSCRGVLTHAERNPMLDGHLSIEYGFMPPAAPSVTLPGKYAIWNEFANQIPELYFSNKTQSILEQMPLLDAEQLADEDLSRASIVLSVLAHAYWRHGVNRAFQVRISSIGPKLPYCIYLPWQTIIRRLGRGHEPYQSFYDLFINNFKLKNRDSSGSYDLQDLSIENLDVLVPAFNNEAERVFFMSFVEMHALASPLIGMICEIEKKLEQQSDDLDVSLLIFFDQIGNMLRQCIKTLLKISPIPASKTFCDPILWSKTIAIFAVAPSSSIQGGTSGAFAPMTLVLDALLNRQNYQSNYGQYVDKQKEKLLPKPILDFVIETSKLQLANYIIAREKHDPDMYHQLKNSYNQLIDIYAGPEGFLGKHTSKVFNYLGVSTMVGRNQSTSGDERFVHQNTWVDVCANLKISRLERRETNLNRSENVAHFPTPDIKLDMLPEIDRLELARHHMREDCWIAINDRVYDVTDFLAKHPGGDTIIIAYAGRDVTEHFSTISGHQKPVLAKLMSTMLVGKYVCSKSMELKYVPWMNFVNKLLFIRSITAAQFHHLVDKKLEILFAGHTHTHFIHEHIPEIINVLPFKHEVGKLEGPAWDSLVNTQFVTTQDLRGDFSESQLVHFSYIAQIFEKESLSLVDELIEFILERIDTHEEMGSQTAQTCVSIILRWLKSHLKTIHIIERQEVSLFGHSLMDHGADSVLPIDNENHTIDVRRDAR